MDSCHVYGFVLFMVLYALAVFIIFCLDGHVFMLSQAMHLPEDTLRLFLGLVGFPAPHLFSPHLLFPICTSFT